MNSFFDNLDWDNWIYALIYAIVGGGAGAVSGAFVVAITDPAKFNFQHLPFYELVGAMFLANGVISGFGYLKQNPLPKLTTTTTVETTVKQTHPTATVVTTVEKKEVS